jgi:protein TonB
MHGGAGLAGIASLEDRRLRLLGWALLGSLVLHALILLLLPILRNAQEARVAPPITAHLAKPVPPKPAPPEPPKTEPLPPQPRQTARPQPRPAPVLSTAATRPTQDPPAAAPVLPQAPEPPQAARVEAPSSAPVATASVPDPGSLAQFRVELMEIARRYKRYPRIAQDNNWEGRVELRVAFAASGGMSVLTVRKSAGRAVLDEEAQAMIRSALPHAAIPPALRGKAFVLEIAVDFSLKNER